MEPFPNPAPSVPPAGISITAASLSAQDLPQERLRPFRTRGIEEIIRRVGLDDRALVHEDDPVADLPRKTHFMRDADPVSYTHLTLPTSDLV